MKDSHYRTDYERMRPHTVRALVKASYAADAPHWVAKFLALLLLLLCLGLGMVGLILPVVPGLLFLAFGAMIAGAMFPSFARHLQRFPSLARLLTPYLESSHGFMGMSWQGRCKLLLWVTVKVMVDSFMVLWAALARLLDFVGRDKPRFE
ncbi:MAG TPA: hypothetical protein VMH83_10890 [Candidatus Acidoferrum sp.]|nr:hypothetical protein [Candidatus Acidoferrum sp.]